MAVSGTDSSRGEVLDRLFALPEKQQCRAGERLIRAADAYAQAQNLALELEAPNKDEATIRLCKHLG